MSVLVGTSVLIGYLRGREGRGAAARAPAPEGRPAGKQHNAWRCWRACGPYEEALTRSVQSGLRWHPVDEQLAEKAGVGRSWLPSHRGVDAADLAVAATAVPLEARRLTLNVRHSGVLRVEPPLLTRPPARAGSP